MLVGSENLFAIDEQGVLNVWNLSTLEKTFESTETEKYLSIAENNNREVILATENGVLVRLNESEFTTELYLETKRKFRIEAFYFNSRNEPFFITPFAVYDAYRDKYWSNFQHQPNGMIVSKRFLFFFKKGTNTYFIKPDFSFIDSQDRIWMTKSFGEFGGSLQLFDSWNGKILNSDFENLNFGLLFPKSVFEDNQSNIFVTSGLQHFNNSGEIWKIEKNSANPIYDSEDFSDSTRTNNAFGGGIFVGPGTYNSNDNLIYFATNYGIYRAAIPDSGRIEETELFLRPTLTWDREPLAIGMSMAVKKLSFTTNNELVFLTSNDGIGFYRSGTLRMLK